MSLFVAVSFVGFVDPQNVSTASEVPEPDMTEEEEIEAIRAKHKRKREQEEEEANKRKRDSSLTKEDVSLNLIIRVSYSFNNESDMSLYVNVLKIYLQVAAIVKECIKPITNQIKTMKKVITNIKERTSDIDTSQATPEKTR